MYAHVMNTNEVLAFYRLHKNSTKKTYILLVNLLNPINTHLYILVNTLGFIYIEHDIYYNCIHQKDSKLYKCK
jgi:hypothetical protein